MYKFFLLIIAVAYIAVPTLSFAAHANGIPFWGLPDGGVISCTGYTTNDKVGEVPMSTKQHCTNFCDMVDTVINIIYYAMTLALFVFAPILFVWGGLMILVAGANPSNLESAKKILQGTAIGVVIVLTSFLMIKTLVTVIGFDLPGFTPGASSACSI